jgi:hypothetical protein
LTLENSSGTTQNLDQRPDADVIVLCDIPQRHRYIVDDVELSVSQDVDIFDVERHIGEATKRSGGPTGHGVQFRAGQLQPDTRARMRLDVGRKKFVFGRRSASIQ